MLASSDRSSAPLIHIPSKTSSVQKADLLNQYLAEVRRYPLLSPEEERKLAIQ